MHKRLTIALLLAVATGSLLVAPVSAGPGALVTRNDAAINDLCAAAAVEVEGVEGVSKVKSLWLLRQGDRKSKLFCRFKGADVDLGSARVIRLKGADAIVLCPAMDGVGDPLYAKLKMNHRGNGFLKCVYAPLAT